MADDNLWRRRFYIFMGARLFGLATFIAGLAIYFTNILRPGGWPLVGGIVMAMGLIDSVVAPKMLKKQWDKSDREK